MKRRNFLSLLGAAGAAPMLPAPLKAAPVAAAGYNRYMYGLAVFHARTRASITAGDLIAKLRVSGATANALMSEMASKGVLMPALNSAGAMQAVSPNGQSGRGIPQKVGDAARQFLTPDDEAERNHRSLEASQTTSDEAEQDRSNVSALPEASLTASNPSDE
ncbi:MAG: hypothetical protein QNJ20_07145 [Paracoccaceae bacterium]|nr:hypothetical protein [Paracoccaceae bacterium]